jgi:cardiolipin synthase
MLNNLPNILTFTRIAVIPIICVFLFFDPPMGNWVAFSFYTYACITDFFDGYLARSWQQQSSMGRFLDPIADKLLVATVLLILVAVDRIIGITILAAAIILCREILVSGLREFLAEIQVGMPVSRLAKWKTVLQMLALGFLLVGGAGPDFGLISTTQIGVIGLWASAMLTLATGYDYFRAGAAHLKGGAETPPQGDQDGAPKVDAKKDAKLARDAG